MSKHKKSLSKSSSNSSFKSNWKKVWKFIWEDDSALSWLANIVVAFVLIKFIVYPLLALVLGTQLPIVAVISESMSHTPTDLCEQRSLFTGDCVKYDDSSYEICATKYHKKGKLDFDTYWKTCGPWYEDIHISKTEFESFKLKNGFEKGDVIVLGRADPEKLEVGDILVFLSNLDSTKSRPYPIIHRIVKISQTSSGKIYSTKGDHNGYQITTFNFNEKQILEAQVLGRGVAKIPYIGYIKLWFVDLLRLVGLA